MISDKNTEHHKPSHSSSTCEITSDARSSDPLTDGPLPTASHSPVSEGAVPALDVNQVSITYGDHRALDKVSLNVTQGCLTALVGPNGAGKSSLVKAICGRITVKEGSIAINGLNAASRGARKTLGVAPQQAALYNHLTALENLICFARQMGLSKQEAIQNANAVLSTIGMAQKGDVLVGRMSGGMRQRINIGAAIIHRPSLIILDEPAASLDPDGIEQINQLIERLKKEQFSILLITHHMEQASRLADIITIFQNGKLCASGSLQNLIGQYCGSNAMLTVRVSPEKDNDINKQSPRHDSPFNNIHKQMTDLGFTLETGLPPSWSKFINHKSDYKKELQQLEDQALKFSSFSVTTPDLNVILDIALREDEEVRL